MYPLLLLLHSLLRWLVLCSLVGTICLSLRGVVKKKTFTAASNKLRYWTVTFSHLQLIAGMILYFQSPVVRFPGNEQIFFTYVHISCMLMAVVVITIGAARTKRMKDDAAKYKTQLAWFSLGLSIILAAIPWPFSPLAHRPYIRSLW